LKQGGDEFDAAEFLEEKVMRWEEDGMVVG
jgi:hypothetical protein